MPKDPKPIPRGTKFATTDEKARLNKLHYAVADELAKLAKEYDASSYEIVTVTLELLAGMVHVIDLDVENVMELLKYSVERMERMKNAN